MERQRDRESKMRREEGMEEIVKKTKRQRQKEKEDGERKRQKH
jgi:hypothetical protein